VSPKVRAKTKDDKRTRAVEITVNKIPDSCPICHKSEIPENKFGWMEEDRLEMVFQCPNEDCRRLFMGYYIADIEETEEEEQLVYYLKGCAPQIIKKKDFPEEIALISKRFCEIYNEAHEAEIRGLINICGIGYRTALETLIKDFLIREKIDKSDIIHIATTHIINCINQYIDSDIVRHCVKKMDCLGPVETQFTRVWKKKDIQDLKDLIQLVMNWIHDEQLMKRIEKDKLDQRFREKD